MIIIFSFCWNSFIPPIPELLLFVVKERLKGLNYNIECFREGVGYTGEGDRYMYYAKKGHVIEVSQHFLPSL